MFNCDGQLALDTTEGVQQYGGAGAQMTYINYGTADCGGHSQFARVLTPASGDDPNQNVASFQDVDASDIAYFQVERPSLEAGVFEDYYCGGFGAIHIYGLSRGFELEENNAED